MAEPRAHVESLHFSVGVLGIAGGVQPTAGRLEPATTLLPRALPHGLRRALLCPGPLQHPEEPGRGAVPALLRGLLHRAGRPAQGLLPGRHAGRAGGHLCGVRPHAAGHPSQHGLPLAGAHGRGAAEIPAVPDQPPGPAAAGQRPARALPGVLEVGPEGPLGVLVLPWVVVAGGALQLVCGSVAFARGKTLESTAFILYGIMWVVWGLTRYGGLYGSVRGFNVAVGIICFMLFNCFVTAGALFLSKAWFAYAFTFELILISFLLDAVGALPYGYDIGVTIIFGLVSFYCFLANLFNSSFQSPQLPLGSPFVKLSGYGSGGDKCPHVPARKATSVLQIAEILKNGGACGMPTDTVYVLVAACNRPDAVEKAYK
uniref:Uncharacterized protein n=1 Tax=Lepisosteus oculatus TaxID=7918 RepID=W5NCF4_LEPOC